MRIAIYDYYLRHAEKHLTAFGKGLQQHGQDFVRVRLGSSPVHCDLAVVWGYGRRDVFASQRLSGGRFLVMERGYIGDRKRWISAGYDGLNGRADFCNAGRTAERLQKNFPGLLKPWKKPGEYILVMGQCRWDQSIRHVDIRRRLTDAIDTIRAHSLIPIYFRPHPEDPEMPAPPGSCTVSGSLDHAFIGAHAVVTLNSNSGVDAVVAGVPVIALDRGSMTWAVAGHRAVEVIRPPRPARERWAAELAWCQWSDKELVSGECWQSLKLGMKRGYHRAAQA